MRFPYKRCAHNALNTRSAPMVESTSKVVLWVVWNEDAGIAIHVVLDLCAPRGQPHEEGQMTGRQRVNQVRELALHLPLRQHQEGGSEVLAVLVQVHLVAPHAAGLPEVDRALEQDGVAGHHDEAHLRDHFPDGAARVAVRIRRCAVDVAHEGVPRIAFLVAKVLAERQGARCRAEREGLDRALLYDRAARQVLAARRMQHGGAPVEELGLQGLARGELAPLPLPKAVEVLLIDAVVAQADDVAIELTALVGQDASLPKVALASLKELRAIVGRHEDPGTAELARRREPRREPPVPHRPLALQHRDLRGGVEAFHLQLLAAVACLVLQAHVGVEHELAPLALDPPNAQDVALAENAEALGVRVVLRVQGEPVLADHPRLPVAADRGHDHSWQLWRYVLEVGPGHILPEDVAADLHAPWTQHLDHAVLGPAVDLRALLHVHPPVTLVKAQSHGLLAEDQDVMGLHLELHWPDDAALRVDPRAPLAHEPVGDLREVRRVPAHGRLVQAPPVGRLLGLLDDRLLGSDSYVLDERADLWMVHLDVRKLQLRLRDHRLRPQGQV
mmetsp:Transcript_23413/g.55425  ORF Transcript_23413/g.55425 Transcript_23413/m.55425 type:complete len:559 (+) Transcript_23413:1-1677(+)